MRQRLCDEAGRPLHVWERDSIESYLIDHNGPAHTRDQRVCRRVAEVLRPRCRSATREHLRTGRASVRSPG
jgi:hypothetical protein